MLWNIIDEPQKSSHTSALEQNFVTDLPQSGGFANQHHWSCGALWLMKNQESDQETWFHFSFWVWVEKNAPSTKAFGHAMKWRAKWQLAFMCMFVSKNRISFLQRRRCSVVCMLQKKLCEGYFTKFWNYVTKWNKMFCCVQSFWLKDTGILQVIAAPEYYCLSPEQVCKQLKEVDHYKKKKTSNLSWYINS